MRLNLLKTLNENFGIKVFATFTLFIFAVSFSFTSFFIHHQRKSLRDTLIKNGKLLARILAHNSRIGVFSENEALLKGPVEGIFQQEGVLEVSVFNPEGDLLTKRERSEIRTPGKSVKVDGGSMNRIFEQIKEFRSPFYLEGNSRVEFWSPVISGSGYSMKEFLFFEKDPLQRKDRIIGFVGITVDKEMLNKRLNDLLFKSILIGIVFLVIGSGVTYLVVKGITKPLKRLTGCVKTLGTEGVVEEIPVETEDEIGELAKAFNNMSESLKRRERALRESEERYRTFFETSKDPVFITSKDGRWLDSNHAAVELFGYENKDELMKSKMPEFFENPEERKRYQEIIEEHGFVKDFSVNLQKKGGSIINALITSVARKDQNGNVVGYQGTLADITERKQAEEALLESERRLRFLSSQLIAAQENERRRISLELHDEMGQSLTAVDLNLAEIEKELPSDLAPMIREKLAEARSITEQASEQIGALSLYLRPLMLDDLGLVPTLRWYLNRYSKRTNVEVKFEAIDMDERLDTNVETVFYRIVQEALNNIAKHAEAKQVIVRLECKGEAIAGCIKDDGKGFDVNEILMRHPKDGIGLIGMKERAAVLGGSLSIQSRKGHGTQISVEIPLH